ncbi:MAG: nucleotidyl transferase AbiEii/AbiGii toxin family protein, partial [Bacteroidetes bacterium]|nr:nucleotidyl transferase AbiEii/AbiGii toxin family protein [Bacteroidota bacterium]
MLLSRNYFSHRYSDDLDLFVNSDSNFENFVELFFKTLNEREEKEGFIIDKQNVTKSNNYMQIFLSKETANLKIDLVNDI